MDFSNPWYIVLNIAMYIASIGLFIMGIAIENNKYYELQFFVGAVILAFAVAGSQFIDKSFDEIKDNIQKFDDLELGGFIIVLALPVVLGIITGGYLAYKKLKK